MHMQNYTYQYAVRVDDSWFRHQQYKHASANAKNSVDLEYWLEIE